MVETPNFSLPLLSAAQSQKHVTLNEALLRLDALCAMSVQSATTAVPPSGASDGDCYLVPSGAEADWLGHEGEIAFWISGGWSFEARSIGWRVWVVDESCYRTWSGAEWLVDLLSTGSFGETSRAHIQTIDQIIMPGTGFDTALNIPDRAVVLGVTGRVVEAITGVGVSSWKLGIASSADRYANGVGLELNDSFVGVSGSPVGYYGNTALRVEPDSGQFSGGRIRLAIHFWSLTPPDAV